jgi:trans-aconitate methyltransferase
MRGKVFPATRAGSVLNPLRGLIQSPTRTVERMDLASTDKVLEIGCGPGYFSGAIAAAVPNGSLVLFDLQLAMLEIARRRLPGFASSAGRSITQRNLIDGALVHSCLCSRRERHRH